MLRVRTLGVVPYHEAFALQHALATGSADDYLLVLQHPPVYTLGVHADPAHVLTDPASVGATLEQTDRGGDVTYHGPGQLVAYPIVSVPDHPSAGPAHVHRLEQLIVDTLGDVGLAGAAPLDGYPGVWVGGDGATARKIAAVGVRTVRSSTGVRRTLHGVALNVDCDLAMFGHIVPCGIADRPVTSLRAEGLEVPLASVAEAFISRAAALFGPGALDRQDVTTGPATGGDPTCVERPLLRRLRQAGVAPEAGLQISRRKPEWLRVPVHMGKEYLALGRTVHDLGLATVCEEAGCPNIYECWSEGTATFMINGERCTRACGFCQVDTRHPLPLAPDEPDRVSRAVERMGLGHAVVTCVARRRPGRRRGGRHGADHRGDQGAVAGDDRRGAHLGLPGRCGLAGGDLRRPAGRAEPQHRDRGPPPAGRAALGRLRPQPGRAGPGGRLGSGRQVGADGGTG